MLPLCELGWHVQLERICMQSTNVSMQTDCMFGLSELMLNNPKCIDIMLSRSAVCEWFCEFLLDKTCAPSVLFMVTTALHNLLQCRHPKIAQWMFDNHYALVPLLARLCDTTRTVPIALCHAPSRALGIVSEQPMAYAPLGILVFLTSFDPQMLLPALLSEFLQNLQRGGTVAILNFFLFEMEARCLT